MHPPSRFLSTQLPNTPHHRLTSLLDDPAAPTGRARHAPLDQATHTTPRFGFTSFHQATQAVFLPADPPDREPDFVSPSKSVYWDLGWGVLRASDHWVGLDGCTHQASCRWELHNDPGGPGWRSGSCAYTGFTPYTPARPTLQGDDRDAAIAAWMIAQGGACTRAAWDASGWGTPPRWVRTAWTGSAAATIAAQRLLASLPQGASVYCASPKALQAAIDRLPIPWP